jgi:D-psicose/D-tagatose/L-ribulose 3-epimerase
MTQIETRAWPPKIGVISMTYVRPFTAAHFPLFARMRGAGMEFCELLVPEEGELAPEAAAEAAKEAGLALVLAARVNVERDLASEDAAARTAGIAYLRRCVDVAVACGADLVGGPLYGTPLVFAGRAPRPFDAAERAERVARVVEGLRLAGVYAAQKGVRLAVEPLNRFETDFCNTGRQAVELARLVGNSAVGVMLDTFHMNMEENDMAEAIRHAAPYLMHFQANENHRGFLGTGHLDWPVICRALYEIGYQGVITLEPFRRADHALSVPLAQWKPPAYDEDEDLRHSGALLRAALHAAARS